MPPHHQHPWWEQQYSISMTGKVNPNNRTLVPFAKDGSYFHPGLRDLRPRARTYWIGSKDSSEFYSEFDEALFRLSKMKVAAWRRPNASGNWGVVSAVRWAPLPQQPHEKETAEKIKSC
jgi:hypothetical protein